MPVVLVLNYFNLFYYKPEEKNPVFWKMFPIKQGLFKLTELAWIRSSIL